MYRNGSLNRADDVFNPGEGDAGARLTRAMQGTSMNTEAPEIGDRITVNTLLKRGEKPLFSFKIGSVCPFFALP